MRLGGLGFGTDPYAMLCYAVACALIFSEIFRGLQIIFNDFQVSEIFRDFQRFSEIFRDFQRFSEVFRNFSRNS